jgi:hypothetical protein
MDRGSQLKYNHLLQHSDPNDASDPPTVIKKFQQHLAAEIKTVIMNIVICFGAKMLVEKKLPWPQREYAGGQ